MIKTFTQNDLMRRLYLETSAEETKEIDHALLCDDKLQQQYKELLSIKKELDEAHLVPSDSVTDKILLYAKGLQEH